MEHGV